MRVAIALLAIFFQSILALNKYVDDFEPLNYKPILASRRKRSLSDDDNTVDLIFRAHNRQFNLRLKRAASESIFSFDHVIDVDGVPVSDTIRPEDFLYEGFDRDDDGSHAYGSILDGIFDGHVHMSDGRTYTIEKASRYFDKDSRPIKYHSIVYADDKINHESFRAKRHVHSEEDDEGPNGCGLTRSLRKKMHTLQESGDGPYDYEPLISHLSSRHRDFDDIVYGSSGKHNRTKRAPRLPDTNDINGRRLFHVRTCSIYLQADQKLYEHVFHKEGNRDHVRTREEIFALFYNHIKAVNQIYEDTNFGGITGLNFVIQRTTIFTPDTCLNGGPASGSDNPFCEDNVDVSNFLNLNSQRNHSAFCLAYALTFRDFVGGTLGLAWVASPSFNTAGGICQVYQKYNEGSRGMVYRSLNTGIVTLVNYGNRVPARVSQLTLAHEIGHNFGSPHDYPSECQPGLPDGNFIMFASATSGDKVNNARFSACSVKNISMVLYEVLSQVPVDPLHSITTIYGKKRNCFQERTSAFCGNQIREPGEDCDCGFSDKDCQMLNDQCCNPHEVNGRYNSATACKRVAGKQCSPSEGLCCDSSSCSFFPASTRRSCLAETECTYEQFCDGQGPECPEPMPKTDGLPCQDATKVCQSGSCNGSICAMVGLKDCFLTEGVPAKLCHLACEKNGKCLSSFELPEFRASAFNQSGRAGQPGLLLHPGSPCNDYKGYCDIFRKCRSVDSNGPLARLKNLLFNKHTIRTVTEWAHENWWACVLIGIGILLFMALFVKCCAVHTPSTNPNKAPAAHFTDTLRHPGTLLRRGRHHRGIPPHGRVNGIPAGVPPTSVAPSARANRQRRSQPAAASGSASSVAPVASSRTPANVSAPPLIGPPTPPSTSTIPPVEPPPPYSVTDPSLSSSASTSIGPFGSILVPAPLPGAPAPPPPTAPAPMLPIIPGQGPKPGRRQRNKADDNSTGKNKSAVSGGNKRSAR